MIEGWPPVPSVVGLTLNYRDAARTLRCVSSLLADQVPHVLVWDNSEDSGHSANDLRSLIAGDPRVSIAVSDHNMGFAAGVNRGLAWISTHFPGAWVLLINNDAILVAGATIAMVQKLERMPEAVIAYPTIDHGGSRIGTAFYQPHFGLITKTRLPGGIPYASGCCQLLDPSRLEGPWFDEEFFMYGEDMELGYRLGMRRMLHVPDAWVLHEGSASSHVGSLFYETRMVAGHWLLVGKLAKNRFELVTFYVGRGVSLILRAVLRAWRHGSWEPLKGLREGTRLAIRSIDAKRKADS